MNTKKLVALVAMIAIALFLALPNLSWAAEDGAALYKANCAMCHGADDEFPIKPRVAGRSETQLYDIIGDLPARNAMMPPFEGTDAERRALAQYLAAVGRR